MPKPNAPYAEKLEFVRALKEAKKLDIPDTETFNSPLVEAALHDDIELVKLLLDNGASTEAPGSRDQTALMQAASKGNLAIFQLLLQHGANVNLIDLSKRTVLIRAVQGGNPQIVELLLNRSPKPDLSAVDDHYHTALFHAMKHWKQTGDKKTAVLLLSHGTPIDASNGYVYKDQLLSYAAECLKPRSDDPESPLYDAKLGLAIFERYLKLYPDDKKLTQEIQYVLTIYHFTLNPNDEDALSAVLAINPDIGPQAYAMKHQLIYQYFTNQGYPLTPAMMASIKPIIDLSHTDPALAKDALDNIGAYFVSLQKASIPAQPGIQEPQAIEAAPEIKAPAVSRAAALAQYAQDLEKAKQNINDDASLYVLKKYSVVYAKNIHPMDMKRGEIYLSKTGDQYIIANQVPGKPAHSGSLSDLSDLGKNVLNKKERAQLKKELNNGKNKNSP